MGKNYSKGTDLSKGKVIAIDLFCGAGGLTHGLEKAGIKVHLGIDIDPACETPYTQNNKARFLLKPVQDLKWQELKDVFEERGIRLLAGCAPCQTFSTYNQKARQSDRRWWLLLEFSRLIRQLSPELVTMENVPRLMDQNVFKCFVKSLKKSGYHVNYEVVNCADYGIPQHRQRLVLLASKFGPIKMLTPKELRVKPQTVREAIGGLPPISAGKVHKKDPLHQSAFLSPINLRRIMTSRPGGTWRDWKKDLVSKCHRKKTGKTYPSVYGRMNWDEPAPTMTTQFFGFGNGRFGHPEQNRAISLREGAILQSFPHDYIFTAPENPIFKKIIGRLIGNAVPVRLGEVIGRSIRKHILSIPTEY